MFFVFSHFGQASAPVNAPEAGIITEFLVEEGDVVLVGAPLFKLQPASKPSQPKEASTPAPAPAASVSAPATPAPPKAAAPKSEPKPAAASTQEKTQTGGVTRVKMSRMRKRTAERLKESQNTAAMLTTFNEIDMRFANCPNTFSCSTHCSYFSNIMQFRKENKDAVLKKHDVKVCC